MTSNQEQIALVYLLAKKSSCTKYLLALLRTIRSRSNIDSRLNGSNATSPTQDLPSGRGDNSEKVKTIVAYLQNNPEQTLKSLVDEFVGNDRAFQRELFDFIQDNVKHANQLNSRQEPMASPRPLLRTGQETASPKPLPRTSHEMVSPRSFPRTGPEMLSRTLFPSNTDQFKDGLGATTAVLIGPSASEPRPSLKAPSTPALSPEGKDMSPPSYGQTLETTMSKTFSAISPRTSRESNLDIFSQLQQSTQGNHDFQKVAMSSQSESMQPNPALRAQFTPGTSEVYNNDGRTNRPRDLFATDSNGTARHTLNDPLIESTKPTVVPPFWMSKRSSARQSDAAKSAYDPASPAMYQANGDVEATGLVRRPLESRRSRDPPHESSGLHPGPASLGPPPTRRDPREATGPLPSTAPAPLSRSDGDAPLLRSVEQQRDQSSGRPDPDDARGPSGEDVVSYHAPRPNRDSEDLISQLYQRLHYTAEAIRFLKQSTLSLIAAKEDEVKLLAGHPVHQASDRKLPKQIETMTTIFDQVFEAASVDTSRTHSAHTAASRTHSAHTATGTSRSGSRVFGSLDGSSRQMRHAAHAQRDAQRDSMRELDADAEAEADARGGLYRSHESRRSRSKSPEGRVRRRDGGGVLPPPGGGFKRLADMTTNAFLNPDAHSFRAKEAGLSDGQTAHPQRTAMYGEATAKFPLVRRRTPDAREREGD
jgi:hypothetical protein